MSQSDGQVRALVVDDDPSMHELFDAMLSAEGVRVSLAWDGAQAAATVGKQSFDLIIMDFYMPTMDGIAATIRIREHERRAGLRAAAIVFVTACDSAIIQRKAREAGADAYLVKPFDFDGFRKFVRQLHPASGRPN